MHLRLMAFADDGFQGKCARIRLVAALKLLDIFAEDISASPILGNSPPSTVAS